MLRARCTASPNVVAVLLERHAIRRPTVHFATAMLNLRVPCLRCVGVRLAVETADQLARQACAFLLGESKDVSEYVRRGHFTYLTAAARSRDWTRTGVKSNG